MDGFTRLACAGCPPVAEFLIALAAEFRDVDTEAADSRLDELALPLFGLADGELRVPTGPGIGVEVDPDKLAHYRTDS